MPTQQPYMLENLADAPRVTSVALRSLDVTERPVGGFPSGMADEDRELARAAAAGDTRAFARLVDRHHGPCVRYAARMLGSLEDAEEVVQDTFVRVWRALPRYDDLAGFRPWLYTILINRCRSRRLPLARQAQRLQPLDGLPREPAAPVVDEAPQFDAEALQAALATLPTEQREAFLLKHMEDLDYDTMTQMTGAGVSALKMRVKRACAALRERLAP